MATDAVNPDESKKGVEVVRSAEVSEPRDCPVLSLMPGNIQKAAPNGVMSQTLCTAFTEESAFPQLQSQYHDGTVHRRQLAQTSRRTFKLAKRLAASDLAALKAFYDQQQGGMTPFFFYNPSDATPTGSNYDPAGNSTVGRYTVVFRGGWQQTTGLARTTIPQIELIEVA